MADSIHDCSHVFGDTLKTLFYGMCRDEKKFEQICLNRKFDKKIKGTKKIQIVESGERSCKK